MTNMGRYYVLGPPTPQRQEVPRVVRGVTQMTPDLLSAPFTLVSLEGPVRYIQVGFLVRGVPYFGMGCDQLSSGPVR